MQLPCLLSFFVFQISWSIKLQTIILYILFYPVTYFITLLDSSSRYCTLAKRNYIGTKNYLTIWNDTSRFFSSIYCSCIFIDVYILELFIVFCTQEVNCSLICFDYRKLYLRFRTNKILYIRHPLIACIK